MPEPAFELYHPAGPAVPGARSGVQAPAVGEIAKALGDSNVQVRSAAAWAFSQIGPKGAAAAPSLAKALSDSDPGVRYLTAIALKEMGPSATPGIPELIRALDDASEYVRSRSADALGSMGPAARAAVGPLADKLLAKAERGAVLTSVALALGNMGPAAKDALPALEQALKMRRGGISVQEAILKIEGKPVQTWR